MPIETRVAAAISEAEHRLHEELHAATASLHKMIAVLERRLDALTDDGTMPKPRRSPRTGKPNPNELPSPAGAFE